MKLLILSHFNPLYGPTVVLKAPESSEDVELEQIPALMDLYDEGFFVHMFGNFKSANYIFDLPSEYARGKNEMLLISIIIDINSTVNFNLSKKLLEGFGQAIKEIPDAYKAFYINSDENEGDESKLLEIQDLLFTFYKSIPEENVIYERKDAKILVFGLYHAGKTTLINCQRNMASKGTIPTINIDISRILVNNISLFTYDTPGQIKFRDLWKPYLKNQDGLVFVLDVSDVKKYAEARSILHNIATKPQLKSVPLLILFNKVDLARPDVDALKKEMGIDELEGQRLLKCFSTSCITTEDVEPAFNWLASKLSERIIPTQKSDVGIIFSRWDEKLGVKIVSIHPINFFDDPDVISMRCFSLSQFIFGGEKFKRISIVIPLTNLKLKAGIYFDYILTDEVRGGALPFSLVVFYDEKIPTAIINQSNSYVFEKLALLKENYANMSLIHRELKIIHNSILKKLKTLPVKDLRIAELRYQALFKAARDVIIIIDRKSGIIVDANEQAEKMLQKSPEEIIGLHISQIKIGKVKEKFFQTFLSQIKIENNPPIEIEIFSIPVEANINEIKLGNQNLIQCILRDITERKLAEKQLKESESQLKLRVKELKCLYGISKLVEKSKISIMEIIKGTLELIPPAWQFPDVTCAKITYDDSEYKTTNFKDSIYALGVNLKVNNKILNLEVNYLDEKPFLKEEADLLIDIGNRLKDIIGKKEAEHTIENRLKFERIFSNISSRFVIIQDINKAIQESFHDMGKFNKTSRINLFIFNKAKNIMKNTHEWCAEGVESHIKNLQNLSLDGLPWLLNKLNELDFVFISDVSKIYNNASTRNFFEKQNVKSLLLSPLQIKGILSGFVGYYNVIKPGNWKDEDYALLSLFLETLGNALERKQAEIDLRESKETFHKAYDRANFYKELFVQDMKNILKNIIISISTESNQSKKKVKILKTIKEHGLGGIRMIKNIQILSQIEDTKILMEDIEVFDILKSAINEINKDYQEREMIIQIDAPYNQYFVHANKILLDVFENILTNMIKYSRTDTIEINIKNTEIVKNHTDYLKMEFIDIGNNDNKDQNISKMEKDHKGMLLGLNLIEQILNIIGGHIWVEKDNFIILIPKSHKPST